MKPRYVLPFRAEDWSRLHDDIYLPHPIHFNLDNKNSRGVSNDLAHPGTSYLFNVPEGLPISPPQDGEIIEVRGFDYAPTYNINARHENNLVLIRHDDGTVARIEHILADVTVGAKVEINDEIGVPGDYPEGQPHVHLHFYTGADVERPDLPVKFEDLPDIPVDADYRILDIVIGLISPEGGLESIQKARTVSSRADSYIKERVFVIFQWLMTGALETYARRQIANTEDMDDITGLGSDVLVELVEEYIQSDEFRNFSNIHHL